MARGLTNMYKALQKDLGISNIHAVPRIDTVVINVGVGKHKDDQQFLQAVRQDLAKITGQVSHERKARKAISGFKIRKGNIVGYRVTLRGRRRDDFIQRFVHVTLPRVRDFRGIARSSIDTQGNLHVGLSEQLAFPEVHADQTDFIFGLEVSFVTTAMDALMAERMFVALGFPLTTKAESDRVLDDTAQKRARKQDRST